MMARSGYNEGMRLNELQIALNALSYLELQEQLNFNVTPSMLAYAAYKGYRFRSPQGAVLAFSKIKRKMVMQGFIKHRLGGQEGLLITDQGKQELERLKGLS